MPARILVDTGFLVALFRPADRLCASAREFLRQNRRLLLTATPVIVETCFFLDIGAKCKLLEWARRGALTVADIPTSEYGALGLVLGKYADREIDIADATLVWLANRTGTSEVLTVDKTDFNVYRLKGNKRFSVLSWFS